MSGREFKRCVKCYEIESTDYPLKEFDFDYGYGYIDLRNEFRAEAFICHVCAQIESNFDITPTEKRNSFIFVLKSNPEIRVRTVRSDLNLFVFFEMGNKIIDQCSSLRRGIEIALSFIPKK